MDKKNLRPILPGPRPPLPPVEDEPPLKKRRKQLVGVACNRCRTKKVACDGNLPACSRCCQLKTNCEYVGQNASDAVVTAKNKQIAMLHKDLQAHVEIINRLRAAPDSEASSIIRQLNNSPSVPDALDSFRNSISLARPSHLRTAQAVSTPTYSNVEFELSALHRAVYPKLVPLELQAIDLESLTHYRRRGSPSPSTVPRISMPSSPEKPVETEVIETKLLLSEIPSPARNTPGKRLSPATGPAHPQQYCDQRLNSLDLGFWTKVPIGNEFGAMLISHYLETEHVYTGWLDIDTFLDDLVHCRLKYCSAFLVSSVLSLACFYYACVDSRASAFALLFFREAEILWRAEQRTNSIVTLASINLLSFTASLTSYDALGKQLFKSARSMAERMKLLGAEPQGPGEAPWENMSPDDIKATAQVAWSTYCWITCHTVFYRDKPIQHPPSFPIPGALGGESIPYFLPSGLPGYLKRSFQFLCEINMILQDVYAVYLNYTDVPLESKVSLAFVESKYQQLLSRTDSLGKDVELHDDSSAHVFVFQALFHIAVLEIFRPMCGETKQKMRSFASVDSTPQAIYDASWRQLKQIVLGHRVRYQGKQFTIWLNTALLQVIGAVLRDMTDPHWRTFFSICMNYWTESVIAYPVQQGLLQVSLSLALSLGRISGAEACLVMESAERRSRHHEKTPGVLSTILDFQASTSAKDGFTALELARKFDDLALFNDWTVDD